MIDISRKCIAIKINHFISNESLLTADCTFQKQTSFLLTMNENFKKVSINDLPFSHFLYITAVFFDVLVSLDVSCLK